MNKMRKYLAIIVVAILLCSCNTNNKNQQKLTGINTLSYTDVEYIGVKDTAIVSTYSGRIAKRINGIEEEELIVQLNDEVYALIYSKERNEIIASTLESGVLVMDVTNGKIKKELITGSSWINSISLSTNGKYLMGFNGQGKNFVWDVFNNYEPIDYPKDFPHALVRFGKGDTLFHSDVGKLILWNPQTNVIVERKTEKGKLMDADNEGNLLFLNHDEFIIDFKKDSANSISKKHSDWPYYFASRDTIYRIPLQMKLTAGCISEQTAFTGGIDRSIRFWDIQTGALKDELLKHRATISGIKISKDQSQIVSVDLKGGVHFTNLD